MQKDKLQIIQLTDGSKKNLSKIFLKKLGVFLSFLIIFILTYSPAIQINYLFMDDYAFVKTNITQEKSLYEEIIDRARDGKVLYGVFLHIISNNIKHDNLFRLLGIIGLSFLSYVLYTILKIYQIKTEHAFLISVLVCTLPSFQLFVAWLVTFPYIYSAILSFTAGLILFKVVSEKNKGISIYRLGSLFIIIGLLMLAALHIYQPTAMLYWAIGIIPLSVLKDEDFKDRWRLPFTVYFFIGFVSLAVYFLTVKILHHVFNVGFPSRGGLIDLTKIPLKLNWFFYCPLIYSLNLWNIFPSYKIAGIVSIIIIGIFLSNILQALKKEKRRSLLWVHCQKLFLITGILLLSYLPNLLVTDNVPAYRTLVSLETAICFLFYFGFLGFLKFIPRFSVNFKDKTVTIFLLILALITTYHAHNNVNNLAMLQANELKYVKSAISEYGTSKISKISEIYIRRPDDKKIIEKGFLYDEFGRPTTSFRWGPPQVLRVALHELGIKRNIKITQGASDESIPIGENIMAIDMTKFNYLSNYNSSITKPQRYCLTFPKRLK